MNKKRTQISPLEHYEEACYELAFYQQLQRDVKEGQILGDGEEKLLAEAAQKSLKKNLQEIEQQIRRTQGRRKLNKHFRGVFRIAAVMLVAASLLFNLATATSARFRARVLHVETEVKDSEIRYEFADKNEDIEVPAEWLGNYFVEQIPEGWELMTVESAAGAQSVKFINELGQILQFRVAGPGGSVRIQTEDTWISYMQIRGNYATIYHHKTGAVTIVWSAGKDLISVECTDRDAAYKTAMAVVPLE